LDPLAGAVSRSQRRVAACHSNIGEVPISAAANPEHACNCRVLTHAEKFPPVVLGGRFASI
jgi:hypothetical protein